MNRLAVKLTISFLIVILISVGIAAYLARVNTTRQFWSYLMNYGERDNVPRVQPQRGRMMRALLGARENLFLNSVYRSLWTAAVVGAAIGILASLVIAHGITLPLRQVRDAVERVQEGDLSAKAPVTSNDEVGELARSFNEMAESLSKSDNLRRRFLSDIVHELRHPLAVMQANIEGMIDGIIEPGEDELKTANAQIKVLSRIVTDLRDLSLAEAGELTLRKADTDITSLISEVVDSFKPQTKKLGIELLFFERLAPEERTVKVDPDRIAQVVRNLISNAVTVSPRGTAIKVTAEKTARAIVVSVRDEGPGIEKEDLPYIFDRFYRTDVSRSRRTGGSGIGLAIVKQLVDAHGGQVSVESKPGHGALFSFTLPIKQKAEYSPDDGDTPLRN